MQFRGPPPADLYHRYVEFKPFVAGMFNSHSIRGRLLNRALHHQHARIYNYDKTTKYGVFQEPSLEMTQQFLDLVHYDQGGRIFTYILTLDGQMRFTETGKEFGIDLLSKHTMHSDVSIYIAFSGEFFLRRIKHPKLHKNDSSVDPQKDTYPPAPSPSLEEGQKSNETSSCKCKSSPCKCKNSSAQTNGAPKSPQPQTNGIANDTDPTHYELLIDNDSGTYRPNAEKLPLLKEYLSNNLPGLKVRTLDCKADADLQQSLKKEQKDKKKASAGGKPITYLQNASMSSLSSSDEEDLDARAEAGDEGAIKEKRYKREMHKFMDGGQDRHHGIHDAEQQNDADHSHSQGLDGTAEHENGRDRDNIETPAMANHDSNFNEKQ